MNNTIRIEDCCMKQTIRNFAYSINGMRLTPLECSGLCAYYYLILFNLGLLVIDLNIFHLILAALLHTLLAPEIIAIISTIINATFIIVLLEQYIWIMKTIYCKCEAAM